MNFSNDENLHPRGFHDIVIIHILHNTLISRVLWKCFVCRSVSVKTYDVACVMCYL